MHHGAPQRRACRNHAPRSRGWEAGLVWVFRAEACEASASYCLNPGIANSALGEFGLPYLAHHACKEAERSRLPPKPLPPDLPLDTAARQTFNRPAQLILVVLPDTGGVGWMMRMGGLGAWAGGLGGALPLLGMPGFLRGRALPSVGMRPRRVADWLNSLKCQPLWSSQVLVGSAQRSMACRALLCGSTRQALELDSRVDTSRWLPLALP